MFRQQRHSAYQKEHFKRKIWLWEPVSILKLSRFFDRLWYLGPHKKYESRRSERNEMNLNLIKINVLLCLCCENLRMKRFLSMKKPYTNRILCFVIWGRDLSLLVLRLAFIMHDSEKFRNPSVTKLNSFWVSYSSLSLRLCYIRSSLTLFKEEQIFPEKEDFESPQLFKERQVNSLSWFAAKFTFLALVSTKLLTRNHPISPRKSSKDPLLCQ